MTQPTVMVEISAAGTVTIDVKGFKGGACAAATAPLEVVLGGAGPQKKKKKPEFFQSPSTGVKGKLTF